MVKPRSSSSARSSAGIGCLQKRKESYWLFDFSIIIQSEGKKSRSRVQHMTTYGHNRRGVSDLWDHMSRLWMKVCEMFVTFDL